MMHGTYNVKYKKIASLLGKDVGQVK
jgi:hypothetical protein